MTDTDIVTRLAREAGMDYRTPGDYDEMHLPGMDGVDVETLTRFAALVAEECAKVADEIAAKHWAEGQRFQCRELDSAADGADKVAEAIRAKFKA